MCKRQIGHRPTRGIERIRIISWSMQSDDEGRANGHFTCAMMGEMGFWMPLPPSFFCAGTVVPQCCAGTAFFCAAAHLFRLRRKKMRQRAFLCFDKNGPKCALYITLIAEDYFYHSFLSPMMKIPFIYYTCYVLTF